MLEFNIERITYTIVKTIDEIEIKINAIRSYYNDYCNSKHVEILLSKIISVEQIKSYF